MEEKTKANGITEASRLTRDPAPLGTCLVTGAAGYLGGSLAMRLAERGVQVIAFDRRRPNILHENVRVVCGDVCDESELADACRGVDTVFHCAAIIDATRYASRSRRERVFAVNVAGTDNTLRAARAAGATRFVHVSTVNVVVDRVIEGGDESERYAWGADDLYSQSKIDAERLVLAASDSSFRTCAIRPGGIYGPGEKQHLRRVVREVLEGRYRFLVAGGEALADNIYIDDLCEALVAAGLALEVDSVAAGRAYFVSDGAPSNYFHFFRPLAEQLGHALPTRSVPESLVRPVAMFAERFGALTGSRPMLTEMELDKLVWHHHFDIGAAERDLGWTPKVGPEEGFARCADWIDALAEDADVVERPALIWWLAVGGGLGLLFALAFSGGAFGWWVRRLPMFPRRTLRAIAYIAIALHVGEAAYAYRVAKRAGLDHRGWALQTLLLGYPSLRLLLPKARARFAKYGGA